VFQANPYLFTDFPTYSFWSANDKRQAKLDNDYFVSSSSNYLTRPFDIETEQGQRKTKEGIKPLTNLVTLSLQMKSYIVTRHSFSYFITIDGLTWKRNRQKTASDSCFRVVYGISNLRHRNLMTATQTTNRPLKVFESILEIYH